MSTTKPFGIGSADELFAQYEKRCNENSGRVGLKCVVSRQRILDAYNAWKVDTKRNKENFQKSESDGGEEFDPDHLKCAAFLTYWLRRERPVISIDSLNQKPSAPFARGWGMSAAPPATEMDVGIVLGGAVDATWTKLKPNELTKLRITEGAAGNVLPIIEYLNHRSRLQAYANEYMAFDFGFASAKSVEIAKQKAIGNVNMKDMRFGAKFVDDFCYFLKFKAISPHSIYFIYRAILNSD